MKRKLGLVCILLCASLAAWAAGFSRPGQIDDVAGIPGKRGYSGDGGDALKARLGNPMGVAVDSHGNLYFSDTANHRVRRIDARTGEVETAPHRRPHR